MSSIGLHCIVRSDWIRGSHFFFIIAYTSSSSSSTRLSWLLVVLTISSSFTLPMPCWLVGWLVASFAFSSPSLMFKPLLSLTPTLEWSRSFE